MVWGRKPYLGPAVIAAYVQHDSYWLVVSTGYFCISYLRAIAVSDFLPLEIHKHLVLPLSSITFTANSQADNHFYKYIYLFLLFQVLYSNGLQKNFFIEKNRFFSVDYVKINELHVVHT